MGARPTNDTESIREGCETYVLLACIFSRLIFFLDETEAQLKLRLSEKDRLRQEAGELRLVNTTASAFLAYAFEIENIQYVLV